MVENTDPIVFYLYNAFNSEEVRQLLIDKFRSSGHCRRIDFIDWDCLNEKPPRGGDLYIFDSVVLSHMCANSYIRKMPEINDKEGIFQWALDTTKYKNANYGVSLMLCADVIISTRQKDKGTANILELDGKVAVPMKSLVSNYYLGYKINMDQTAEKNAKSAAAAMEKMCRMIGGASELPKARVSKNYGIAEFDRGEVDHYVGFTEALRFFHPDDYVVRKTRYSSQAGDEISFLYVNMIALGRDVREEKLLDCMDMMEIIASPEFEHALCRQGGRLNYMLPANEQAYPSLIEEDPIYTQLLEIAASPNNFAFRSGEDYYDTTEQMSDQLLQLLRGGQ